MVEAAANTVSPRTVEDDAETGRLAIPGVYAEMLTGELASCCHARFTVLAEGAAGTVLLRLKAFATYMTSYWSV
jgi:hypothetical protein